MIVFYLLFLRAMPDRLRVWASSSERLLQLFLRLAEEDGPAVHWSIIHGKHAISERVLSDADLLLPNGVMMPLPWQVQSLIDLHQNTDVRSRYTQKHQKGKEKRKFDWTQYPPMDQVRADSLLEHIIRLPAPEALDTEIKIQQAILELPPLWCADWALRCLYPVFRELLPRMGPEIAASAQRLDLKNMPRIADGLSRIVSDDIFAAWILYISLTNSALQATREGKDGTQKLTYELWKEMLNFLDLRGPGREVVSRRGYTVRYQGEPFLSNEEQEKIKARWVRELTLLHYTWKIWKALRL